MKPYEYYTMYGFFFSKIQIPFNNVIYRFFSFENSPRETKSITAVGQNRVLPGVKIECTRG